MRDFQKEILDFWFVETAPAQWFQKSDAFDQQIIERFESVYDKAVQGEFDAWQESAEGVLALCILLDQMPRNMFRDTPKAFATDAKILKIAKQAVVNGLDQELPVQQRRFIYLPFEHSENIDDQRRCVELFDVIKSDDALGYEYALKHLEVIKKYGRFPHRNKILGRTNTPEEDAYLAQPGAGF
jgi:uncharacterized protein (DUF924 family)